jgi:high-affinity nickel-transport protein
MLILLGLSAAATLAARSAARLRLLRTNANDTIVVHSHRHAHDGATHRHPHAHPQPHADDCVDASPHRDHTFSPTALSRFAINRPLLKSFGVGVVHGLAGSAAIALLVLGAIPQLSWAMLYLAIFCAGTIIGMGLITTVVGAPFILASNRMATLHRGLVLGSGLLSFGFGLLLAWQIGIGGNLFGSTPVWMPH